MAFTLALPSSIISFITLLACLLLARPSYGFNRKALNSSAYSTDSGWSSGGATWYGAPTGDGSDINNCGYGAAVSKPPYSSMVACGNPLLFNSGKGCGACYRVKCNDNAACSGNPITLTITDSCLGGVCLAEPAHFDMSGTAFGAMAKPGLEDKLRHAGRLTIEYARVRCNYPGFTIAFHVQKGSNPWYFAVAIEYEDGDGELSAVHLHQGPGGSDSWIPLRQSWGAVYRLDSHSALQAPYTLRLTSGLGKTLTATDVIPAGYEGGATYRSLVNYDD